MPPVTPVKVWDVYGNGGAGGPVDYSTPLVAGLASPTWTPPALAPGEDWTFAVRARDTANGVEELNVDAVVRIVVDGAGADVGSRPPAPKGLTARATAGGGAEVTWWVGPQIDPPIATGFDVWLATVASGPLGYGTPTATVAAKPGGGYHRAVLTGLADGVEYQIGVRAKAAGISEDNEAVALVTGSAVGPDAVDELAVQVVA